MASSDGTQAALGVVGNCIRLLKQIIDATNTNSYVDGGAEFPGRARWITTSTAANDATQATAIRTDLAKP